MRESKFRVWCKNKNQWESDDIFVNPFGTIFHIDRNKRMIQVSKNTHILEQYTGLKDPAKREVFKNDILKITNPPTQIQKIELIGVVEMQWYQWQVNIKKINRWGGFLVSSPPISEYFIPFHTLVAGKEFKRIGNIHQHLELLEE